MQRDCNRLGLWQRNYERIRGHLIQPYLYALLKRNALSLILKVERVSVSQIQIGSWVHRRAEGSASHFTSKYPRNQANLPSKSKLLSQGLWYYDTFKIWGVISQDLICEEKNFKFDSRFNREPMILTRQIFKN